MIPILSLSIDLKLRTFPLSKDHFTWHILSTKSSDHEVGEDRVGLPRLSLPWQWAGLLGGTELPGPSLPGALALALAPALQLSLGEGATHWDSSEASWRENHADSLQLIFCQTNTGVGFFKNHQTKKEVKKMLQAEHRSYDLCLGSNLCKNPGNWQFCI